MPVPQPEADRTDMDWEIHPDGLRQVLAQVSRDYSPKAVYVTENGAAFPDVVDHEGRVLDPERQQYLEAHVAAAAQAALEGVPLKGYFVWGLMDNFEWNWGYWKRFGLVHVDYRPRRGPRRRASAGTVTLSPMRGCPPPSRRLLAPFRSEQGRAGRFATLFRVKLIE
jgi:beta-glucosidase/6-phospho-beta-glucosidase/beta-galactosidase